MNNRSFIITVVASYVIMAIAGIITDMATKVQMASYFAIGRSEQDMAAMMPWLLIGYLITTTVFCYFFVKGREGGGVMEGVRFGACFGVMISGTVLVSYSALPFDMTALITQIVANIVIYMIGGAVAALVYKPAN
ncbi:MAG: hypothetical protein H6912_05135 [Kordiimonadaceae bacterium]|nr:hypothetical protein [Kordiimonadaceae bacterium]